jgi:hypothetical protein
VTSHANTLLQQQDAGQPPELLFVRWDESRGGVAGGWYDPMKLTVENCRDLAAFVVGPHDHVRDNQDYCHVCGIPMEDA